MAKWKGRRVEGGQDQGKTKSKNKGFVSFRFVNMKCLDEFDYHTTPKYNTTRTVYYKKYLFAPDQSAPQISGIAHEHCMSIGSI